MMRACNASRAIYGKKPTTCIVEAASIAAYAFWHTVLILHCIVRSVLLVAVVALHWMPMGLSVCRMACLVNCFNPTSHKGVGLLLRGMRFDIPRQKQTPSQGATRSLPAATQHLPYV
jgi:hypothetical protein